MMEKLADSAKMELAEQGHRATGKGIKSIEPKVTAEGLDKLVGTILANDYLIPVDTGVKAARIPYSPGSGARTSKYIQGLIRWVGIIKPSLSTKERKGMAFAVAAKHKREGMPTRGSYSFSSNGRRTGWVKHGIEDNVERLVEMSGILQALERIFDAAVREAQTNVNNAA